MEICSGGIVICPDGRVYMLPGRIRISFGPILKFFFGCPFRALVDIDRGSPGVTPYRDN